MKSNMKYKKRKISSHVSKVDQKDIEITLNFIFFFYPFHEKFINLGEKWK
jgi:hypothetical protein